MHETSKLYQEILAGPHTVEVSLAIGESGKLITEFGDYITFGGDRILVANSGADSGYQMKQLYTVDVDSRLFAESTPSVGNCIASEIDVVMITPHGEIVRQARITPYVRLADHRHDKHSEWLQKGVFYIDTREQTANEYGRRVLHLTGFDAIAKTECAYPDSVLDWPAKDIDVVREIAAAMGVNVDTRTVVLMQNSYSIKYPAEYTQREVLGYIASLYGGSWVMSDLGELRLVILNSIPPETSYLVDPGGNVLLFGGDRILV